MDTPDQESEIQSTQYEGKPKAEPKKRGRPPKKKDTFNEEFFKGKEELLAAAKEGDIDKILALRGRKIRFGARGRKNSLGRVGVKVDLGVPCDRCGSTLFYNDMAGAECLVCGKMHKA